MGTRNLPPLADYDELVLPILHAEITEVRAELTRVDGKSNVLLTVAGVAITAVLTVLIRPGDVDAGRVLGWLGVGVLAAAVLQLVLAVRPRLTLAGGDSTGFVYYAFQDPEELLEDLHADDTHAEQTAARHLIGLSEITQIKYERVRRAVDTLLGAGALLTLALIVSGLT